jgi:hypothetical protein
MNELHYDRTGKLELGNVYNRPLPVDYYATLSKLEYRIPQEGQPFFSRIIEAIRQVKDSRHVKLIDIGCSYGVNTALLKFGMSMDDLYRHYATLTAGGQKEVAKRDRALFGDPQDRDLEVVGLDTAANAVRYAVEAGLLTTGVTTNLETQEPRQADTRAMAGTDLVISTGCYGYVTETTLERVLEASSGRPWMAHFVLRMFDFDDARAMLESHGYVVEKLRGVYPQRRFASDEEYAHVLANLGKLGIERRDAEATGWYFAELFVARPREIARSMPLDALFGDLIKPAGRN